MKQQIKRREERKKDKYPMRVERVQAVMPRCRNRGA